MVKRKKKLISVYDNVTGKTFYFKSQKGKEKFFDAWDKYVVKVKK